MSLLSHNLVIIYLFIHLHGGPELLPGELLHLGAERLAVHGELVERQQRDVLVCVGHL